MKEICKYDDKGIQLLVEHQKQHEENMEIFYKELTNMKEALSKMLARMLVKDIVSPDNVPSFTKYLEKDLLTIQLEAEECLKNLKMYTI